MEEQVNKVLTSFSTAPYT